MNLDEFYALIDSARDDSDADLLFEVLNELPDDEVVAFSSVFRAELARLNRWSVRGAGYVASGGLGDDGFRDFRSWLIGKGRHAVELVLVDPDALADHLDTDDPGNEGLEYVAAEVLEEREVDVAVALGEEPAEGEPTGEPFDEATVFAQYPRIVAQASEWDSSPVD